MTTEQIVATTATATQSTTQALASLASTKSGKIAAGVVATAVAGYALYKGAKWLQKTNAERKRKIAQAVESIKADADTASKVA